MTESPSSIYLSNMAGERDIEGQFCIEVDFDKRVENPSRVFRTISSLIETFEALDRDLAVSIHSRIEPILLLEDVEAGSIRAWLADKIRDIDDDSLKSADYKRIIGQYLVKAKWAIVNWLDGKVRITSKEEIEDLQEELLQLASDTEVTHMPTYVPIEKTKLLKGIEGITDSISYLAENDTAHYRLGNNKVAFNLSFSYVPDEIEELITKESISTEATMILKVKKPDYLGESMWDFRYGGMAICAKIQDTEWLKRFQARQVDVRPGDSLRVRMKSTQNYDYDQNLISIHYEILQVQEVIPVRPLDQLDAFGDDE